jgi:hypothetical protein
MSAPLTSMLAGARCELRRSCRRLLLTAIAALVAVMGFVMLVGSLYLRLAESMSAPTAAAVTGGGLLVLAGVIALTTLLIRREAAPQPCPVAAPVAAAAPSKISALTDLLAAAEVAIDRDAHAETQVFPLLALLAGCAVGASPQLRRTLADLLR